MITLQQIDAQNWRLEGNLTVASINAVLSTGAKAIQSQEAGASIKVDCQGLDKVDSASVALLVDWLRLAKQRHVSLSFEKLPEKMQKIIQLSNLEKILV
jgi:phospholipid transport system transporter-binding protein